MPTVLWWSWQWHIRRLGGQSKASPKYSLDKQSQLCILTHWLLDKYLLVQHKRADLSKLRMHVGDASGHYYDFSAYPASTCSDKALKATDSLNDTKFTWMMIALWCSFSLWHAYTHKKRWKCKQKPTDRNASYLMKKKGCSPRTSLTQSVHCSSHESFWLIFTHLFQNILQCYTISGSARLFVLRSVYASLPRASVS